MAGVINLGTNTAMDPHPSGSSPKAPDRKIVLLGKAGARKNRVARFILGDTTLNEESEECLLHEGEHAGRRICIVNTPGWDRVSIECTTEKIKKEIIRSVTLCPPDLHALVLVMPINADDELSVNELKSASRHMELLSKRVWNHTVVLFLCEGDVEESTIKEHIHKAEKLLEKCRGRHCVMHLSDSETQVHGLLEEIDSMVEENARYSFQPQASDEQMQSKMSCKEATQKKTIKQQSEEKVEEKDVPRKRRGSLQGLYPSMTTDTEDSERQRERTEAKKNINQNQLPWNYLKPVVVILMSFMGALIGSVAGAQYGTMGAAVGIVTGFVSLLLISLGLVSLIQ
ncbi:GTPase IMAP family member 4-like [Tachysurus fulvidraco]|uniref:GTPase IMAP family member 4-like n=1 Tax=Tachysurus fulvidraco TaxID=1234273 RepID=UPI001FEFB965|nr:GTPase IMAP family member 4-like [Tachysurus fulvidraco]XP_047670129.1 GTPase IMAP family member 4-like [Tachysurus fulvidraco]XP_047670130.1 GTPase IMAP family member 4-like [Tachysurus fulvidraco]